MVTLTCDELEQRWRDLIEGRASPEDVREWTDPWVRGSTDLDPIVVLGLESLHGATGRNRADSSGEISRLFDEWLSERAQYDTAPVAWRHERIRRLLSGLSGEAPDKARAAAAVYVRRGWITEDAVAEMIGPTEPGSPNEVKD